ncbi:MAG: DUF2087 domain-containing protein [Cypionkella sp.]
MTRTTLPLQISDVSTFARNLQRQLEAEAKPGHLALLNMLARAAGFQNHQHLRAQVNAAERIAAPAPEADMKRVEAALRCFDAAGQMTHWPAKTSLQHLCLWALWAHLPRGQTLTEREISTRLNARHRFTDAAILRRTLVELQLVSRSQDGAEYLRREQPPPPEARALIRALALR